MRKFTLLFAVLALAFLPGCISHEETKYHDVARVPVEFQSESAGRIFYEALSKKHPRHASQSKTEVSIPIVFDHKTREVAGPNTVFNDAVARCDTNKDGKITELEATIFAQHQR